MGIGIKRWMLVMSMSAMALGVSGTCFAEASKEQAAPADFQKAFGQSQQEALERLREKDPQAYQQQKTSMERQKKIQEVVGLYFQGKFPLVEAKAALSPLVKQQIQEEGVFSNLEARIKRLEEQLLFLKNAKNQPELLVEERINQMLGKSASSPSAAEGFGFN